MLCNVNLVLFSFKYFINDGLITYTNSSQTTISHNYVAVKGCWSCRVVEIWRRFLLTCSTCLLLLRQEQAVFRTVWLCRRLLAVFKAVCQVLRAISIRPVITGNTRYTSQSTRRHSYVTTWDGKPAWDDLYNVTWRAETGTANRRQSGTVMYI